MVDGFFILNNFQEKSEQRFIFFVSRALPLEEQKSVSQELNTHSSGTSILNRAKTGNAP